MTERKRAPPYPGQHPPPDPQVSDPLRNCPAPQGQPNSYDSEAPHRASTHGERQASRTRNAGAKGWSSAEKTDQGENKAEQRAPKYAAGATIDGEVRYLDNDNHGCDAAPPLKADGS